MGVKKLRSIFMRYIFVVAGGILFLMAVNVCLYIVCVNTGHIVTAAQVDDKIADIEEKMQADKSIHVQDIPSFCDYAVYSSVGGYLHGSFSENAADSYWKEVVVNGAVRIPPYRFLSIDHGEEVLLLRYRLTAQFSNVILRKMCPSTDLLLIVAVIAETIVWLVLVAYQFGKHVGKKMDKMLSITQKIERQDLDFEIDSSGIFEIDRALDALDHLKQALKISFTEQWRADKLRQDQISALAHDLKTPLTIIRGNAELLSDTPLADRQRECADYIENSAIQMQDYLELLIGMTRTKETLPFQCKEQNISSFLNELHTLAKGLCGVKKIQLDMEGKCSSNIYLCG